MENIKLIVFDLDGTLVESSDTIYKTTIKTFQLLNMDVSISKSDLDKRIGAHFKDIFDELNIVVNDIESFIDLYKSVYFNFIDETILYPFVEETFINLKEKNFSIALLTTKAQEQAERIISHFNLNKYFDFLMGRRKGIGHKPSPEPLLYICNSLSILPKHTLMVGDSELDIQCGKIANAFTCGVTYGYRTESQLKNEKPDFLINNISELLYHLK